MCKNIINCSYAESTAKTGTFLIVANHKVLHARSTMKMDKELTAKIARTSDYSSI